MGLSWVLCDRLGRRLMDIGDREGGVVTIIRSGRRSAQVAVSLESPVAAALEPFESVLKVFLGADPIFAGICTLPRFNDPERFVQIAAADPSVALEAPLRGFATQTGADQSEIVARLIEHVDTHRYSTSLVPSHGIIRGSLPASVNRDRSYLDGKQAWEAIQEMAAVIGAVDFELEPVDRSDGVLCELNTYHPRQGTDKTGSVVFEYGFGQHTATGFVFEPGGGEIVNQVVFAGRPDDTTGVADAWLAYQPESQARYGLHERFALDADVTVVQTMREHAEEVVAARAFPAKFFSFLAAPEEGAIPDRDAVAYGVPPVFGPTGDYWIGDEITVVAKDSEMDETVQGRVQSAVLTEDKAGNVYVACACSPRVVPTNVQGSQITVTPVEATPAPPAAVLPPTDSPGVPGVEPGPSDPVVDPAVFPPVGLFSSGTIPVSWSSLGSAYFRHPEALKPGKKPHKPGKGKN